MKIKRLFYLTFILFNSQIFAFAQKNIFKWNDEMCLYEGGFDSSKYTSEQLDNTYRLWFSSDFILETESTAWTIEDVKKLSIDELNNEFEQKHNALKNLNVVNVKYWKNLKEKQLKELEQVYHLKKVTILAYRNPSVLKDYALADSCLNKYYPALHDGGEKLLQAWKTLNEEKRKSNANPERLKGVFMTQYASPDKYKYARLEIMSFGWWNCANISIAYVNHDNEAEMFKKLFVKITKEECEDFN
jgi:hypothetical protein